MVDGFLTTHQIWTQSAQPLRSSCESTISDTPHAACATRRGEYQRESALVSYRVGVWATQQRRPLVNRTCGCRDMCLSKASLWTESGRSYSYFSHIPRRNSLRAPRSLVTIRFLISVSAKWYNLRQMVIEITCYTKIIIKKRNIAAQITTLSAIKALLLSISKALGILQNAWK